MASTTGMNLQTKRRPPVPSSCRVQHFGGGAGNLRAGGAKNLWVKTGHQWNLTVGTYNVRSLLTDDRLTDLEAELNNIKWDILGLGEVRRPGIGYQTLNSGHKLFHSGNDYSQAGVGFLINRSIAGNVIEVKGINDRIALLTMELNKKTRISIIQVYGYTSTHEDQEVEDLYNTLSDTLDNCQSGPAFVIGDFNAKVGKQETGEKAIGKFGLGVRNNRGQMLMEFAARKNLKIMNTFFQKKESRKWTWQGPNNSVKNEIDYILTTRPDLIKDVFTSTRLNMGSDHRPVLAKLKMNLRVERRRRINRQPKFDRNQIVQCAEEFQIELQNRFQSLDITEDTDEIYKHLVDGLMDASEKVSKPKKKNRENKLSSDTLELMKKRREMKRQNAMHHIEYREVCKTVRKKIREDCRKHNVKLVKETLEKNKSLKKSKRLIAGGRKQISCINNTSGITLTNQDEILERIEEFYTDLYSSNK